MAAVKPVIYISRFIYEMLTAYLSFCETQKQHSNGYQCWFGTRNSKVLLRILCTANRSGKFKMAAVKPGRNRKYLYLSFQTRQQCRSNGYPHIFVVQQHNGNIADTARCNRMSVIKDGGHQTGSKPEVLISQLLDKIATPFQRLTPHFRDLATQQRHCEYCTM